MLKEKFINSSLVTTIEKIKKKYNYKINTFILLFNLVDEHQKVIYLNLINYCVFGDRHRALPDFINAV